MKLIKSSYEIIEPTGYTIDDIYKSIELVGRVSHKSEHNIKEGSAKEFVDRIINWGHNSCLEFGTVYLTERWRGTCLTSKYEYNKYTSIMNQDINGETWRFITTNYRTLLENNWLDDLKYLCEPTKYHKKRYIVKFILPIGISREFVRHRTFSFMEMSTRRITMAA